MVRLAINAALVTALLAGCCLLKVSCTKSALERSTGREVSWWDAIILGGR
jgi:hypothetical protein